MRMIFKGIRGAGELRMWINRIRWRLLTGPDPAPRRICFRQSGFEIRGQALRRRARNTVQWILIRILWEVYRRSPRGSAMEGLAAREGAALMRRHRRHVHACPQLLCPDNGYSGWYMDCTAMFGDVIELIASDSMTRRDHGPRRSEFRWGD